MSSARNLLLNLIVILKLLRLAVPRDAAEWEA
jgi:hypothetical protein